eukprot:3515_1
MSGVRKQTADRCCTPNRGRHAAQQGAHLVDSRRGTVEQLNEGLRRRTLGIRWEQSAKVEFAQEQESLLSRIRADQHSLVEVEKKLGAANQHVKELSMKFDSEARAHSQLKARLTDVDENARASAEAFTVERTEMAEKCARLEGQARGSDEHISRLETSVQALSEQISQDQEETKHDQSVQQGRLNAENEEKLILQKENESLMDEINDQKMRFEHEMHELREKLEHERKMRESEKQSAIKISTEKERQFKADFERSTETFKAELASVQTEHRGALAERSRVESECRDLRRQIIEIQIEKEEQLAALEQTLKQEQQDHSNTDMRALTESIAKIQSARDELQARAEVHQQELKQLQERTDLERNEFDVWLEKEKSQRITAEKELRESQLSFDAQRNELAHARHRMGALETTVTDWKGQADALRADHRATVERLLGRHADNLQGLERTIGQKDQKIMLLLQQIGSQDLVVSQLKEAKSRQEASLSKAFSSLQQAFPALDGLSSSPETRDPVATDTHRVRRSTRTKTQRVSRRRSGTKIGSETVKMVSESEF